MCAEWSSLNWVTSAGRWGWEILQALRILISLFSKESSSVIWVEMRRLPLLPGWQSRCVLVGSAAVGEGTIIGISLDVTSLVLSADPALSKNCFAHLETLQTPLKAKEKDMHSLKILMLNGIWAQMKICGESKTAREFHKKRLYVVVEGGIGMHQFSGQSGHHDFTQRKCIGCLES